MKKEKKTRKKLHCHSHVTKKVQFAMQKSFLPVL